METRDELITVRYIGEELLRIRDIYSNLYKVRDLLRLKRKCRRCILQIGMMYSSIDDIISHLIKMIISDEKDTCWQAWDVRMEFTKKANNILYIANRLERSRN